MTLCPLSYLAVDGCRYSAQGLVRLSPGLTDLVLFPYSAAEQRYQASQRAAKMSIQGMQPKLSVRLDVPERTFQIVETGGRFIVKPQHHIYPQLPENEDVTMRMAATAGLEVPLHGMVYSNDESLSYFIRRFDRTARGGKLPLEDFAQLTGSSRKTKYNSSMERLVPILDHHCTFPMLEKLKLFRLTLFCFVTGNEDMHLKNFSLISRDGKVELSPAYDLLNTTIALSGAQEEVALPLAGKRRKLRRGDWLDYWAADRLALPTKAVEAVLGGIRRSLPEWRSLLERSFLQPDMKERYARVLNSRLDVMGLA